MGIDIKLPFIHQGNLESARVGEEMKGGRKNSSDAWPYPLSQIKNL
jgi:hypothetical protein